MAGAVDTLKHNIEVQRRSLERRRIKQLTQALLSRDGARHLREPIHHAPCLDVI